MSAARTLPPAFDARGEAFALARDLRRVSLMFRDCTEGALLEAAGVRWLRAELEAAACRCERLGENR